MKKGCLFFDLGNVLVYFSLHRMCKQLGSSCGIIHNKIHELLFNTQIFTDYELGRISTENFFKYFCQEITKSIDFFGFLQALSNIFEPNPDIYLLIEELKKRGHRLILLSNTCEAHFNFIYSHYPIVRLFDEKILSYEVGLRKPDRKIFHTALKIANRNVTSCFYTDDVPEYIQAARAVGLDAEQYFDVKTLTEQLELRGFLDQSQ